MKKFRLAFTLTLFFVAGVVSNTLKAQTVTLNDQNLYGFTTIDAGMIETQKEALEGNAEAQYELGQILAEGTSAVLSNMQEAKYWLDKAANNGHNQARLSLALIYLKGQKEEVEKGIDLLESAGKEGFLEAQTTLGVLYLEGDKVTQNMTKAAFWMKQAYDQGDDLAAMAWNQHQMQKYLK